MFPALLGSEGNAWLNVGTRGIRRNFRIGMNMSAITTTRRLNVRMYLWIIPTKYERRDSTEVSKGQDT